MATIFIDSNIWLRYILQDTSQSSDCIKLIESIANGLHTAFTSSLVLLEIDYVLTFTAKVPKHISRSRLQAIATFPNLTIVEHTDHHTALNLYEQANIKFADCLIATQVPDKTILVTYNKDFQKIKNLQTATPGQVLS